MVRSKWEELKWRNGGRSKDEAEKNAAQILKKIISSDLKKKIGLEENQSPNSRDLIHNGYGDFVSAYKRHGLRLSDIIKKANLKPKISNQSWKNLTFEIAVKFFIEIIKSNEIPLEQNKTPTRKQMRNSKFKKFAAAIDNREYLKYSNTMKLAHYAMGDVWYSFGGSTEFVYINFLHELCIEKLDYQCDEDFFLWAESFEGDHIKFSVETAFRTKGEIEDQAILEATDLESHSYYNLLSPNVDFETILWFLYDPIWFDDNFLYPYYSLDYHVITMVHINDTEYFHDNYPGDLGGFSEEIDPYYPEATWCPLELGHGDGYEEPFGTFPSWIENYEPSDGAIVTIIVCDVDGSAEQVIM